MQDTDSKTLKNRLRQVARRQGLQMRKNRARPGWDTGTFMVVDVNTNSVVASGHTTAYGLSLKVVRGVGSARALRSVGE